MGHPQFGEQLLSLENTVAVSDTGTIAFDGAVFRMETGSPVWFTSAVELDEIADSLIFDAHFVSQPGAEGVLAVYWEEELIGTFDERTALDLPTSYILPLGNDYAPGTYNLSFRLDPYTDVVSSVEISDASSFYAVPEPSTLALLTMCAIGLLTYGWRRRKTGNR